MGRPHLTLWPRWPLLRRARVALRRLRFSLRRRYFSLRATLSALWCARFTLGRRRRWRRAVDRTGFGTGRTCLALGTYRPLLRCAHVVSGRSRFGLRRLRFSLRAVLPAL
ncbi:hypothetical protein [Actinomadura sp. NAK00032]|uniref:hypothetical protein n=1 Tax=Actinomadura sp. NAK00032 TaxID=2742128 RepID=UPI0020C7C34D|nr:hypothetical protein [Actinomadura sp. NAK00032]